MSDVGERSTAEPKSAQERRKKQQLQYNILLIYLYKKFESHLVYLREISEQRSPIRATDQHCDEYM